MFEMFETNSVEVEFKGVDCAKSGRPKIFLKKQCEKNKIRS